MDYCACAVVLSISCCFGNISSVNTEDGQCDGVIFDEVYHERDVIKTGLGKPVNLVLHQDTDLLFFSHTVQNSTSIDFRIMSCHIYKKECSEIGGLVGGYAIAYDQGNDDVYFGGEDGIYRYNFLTKSAEYYMEAGKSIWSLFIKRDFYYIEYPSQKLFIYKGDIFVPVEETSKFEIDHIFISKHNDLYFSNKTALFKMEYPVKDMILLNDELTIRQIAADSNGDVYFCASNGIYVEMKPKYTIKKLVNIKKAFGMAFDEINNVIYSDEYGIYRLVPRTGDNKCVQATEP